MRPRPGIGLGFMAMAGALLWSGICLADTRPGMILELRGVHASDSPGWLDGDLGKLRYGEDDRALQLGQAMFLLEHELGDTLQFSGVASVDEDRSSGADIIEAFLHWRPVPTTGYRWRHRIGVFYPAMSLENRDRAWLSPYSFSNSAINAWIGEELRTIGMETRVERPGMFHGSAHDFGFTAALFAGNDTTGTLLSWRGWALHGRQSGLFERLPLADLPALEEGGAFERQVPWTQPFREIDNSPGYYLGIDWAYLDDFELGLHYYDNRTDPRSVHRRRGYEDPDEYTALYGWHTRFLHLRWRYRLGGDFEIFGQWMDGDTRMGEGNRLVDNGFRAAYLMLTRQIGAHRLSLRYDDFRVMDRDDTELDDNNERGDAWMLAWRWTLSDRWQFGAEGLRIDSHRPARAMLGEAPQRRETVLQLGLQYRL
jgi:hypothetical protein